MLIFDVSLIKRAVVITVILKSMNRKRVLQLAWGDIAFIPENTKQRSLFIQHLPLSKGVTFVLASYLVCICLPINFESSNVVFHAHSIRSEIRDANYPYNRSKSGKCVS